MSQKFSRRAWLKSVGGAGAGMLLPGASPAKGAPGILPLTSTSGVFTPSRGKSFMKFSFDFPEPSVEFEKLVFSFRLYTFENTYGLDHERMRVENKGDGLDIDCDGFVWAGNQMKAPGELHARLRKNGRFVEWTAAAEMQQPIKSIAAIVRGVPRGKISAGGKGFFDPHDDEILFGYPFGGGSLFVAAGMNTPLAVIQTGDQDFFFLSLLNNSVRASRFYFQPGEKGYRVELVYEAEGWAKKNRLEGLTWRAGRSSSLEGAFRPHFEHLERAFRLPDWQTREDVPAWLRKTALALALHGMHWTGYIFNDFARMRKILEWTASQIPPERVLVFLPAWDGRYYWKYPNYQPDPRLGGAEGFRALIRSGQKLGFHMMPMFGTNSANERLPSFSKFSDAKTAQIDGDPFYLNWVDWDNDRHREGWAPYMNVGVDSWREWLQGRIAGMIQQFGVDGYFLDIAGGWENNTRADMHEGTRQLVKELRAKFPTVIVCGEMPYDALMSFVPFYQVFSERAYPPAFLKYARSFQHLSHPAPGRGSSGVHESGFSHFDLATMSLSEDQIPTITVVDDTFDHHRKVMSQIIVLAKQRAGIR